MSNDNFDDFDDVLDDEYETQTISDFHADNLVNSLSKPSNPESPELPIDENTMKQLLNKVQNMPKAKLQQYLKQLTGNNNFNMGEYNINNTSNDDRLNTRTKLRKKLDDKRKNTEKISEKKHTVTVTNNELPNVEDIMKDIDNIGKKTKNKKHNKKQ